MGAFWRLRASSKDCHSSNILCRLVELTLFNWKSAVDSRKNQTRTLGIHPDERQPHKIGANNPQTYPGSLVTFL